MTTMEEEPYTKDRERDEREVRKMVEEEQTDGFQGCT